MVGRRAVIRRGGRRPRHHRHDARRSLLDGDRRLAFRRIDGRSGMPWLTASKLPDLLLFAPHRREDGAQGDLPTHVRTPDGEEMPVFTYEANRRTYGKGYRRN